MTDAINFDDNVPMPTEKKKRKAAPERSLLLKMAVGQSFFEPEDDDAKLDAYTRLKHRGGYATRKSDCKLKFEVHEVTENGINGARIWRTA